MTRQRSRSIATLFGLLAGLGLALSDGGSTLVYLQTIPRGFHGLPRPANLDWIEGWAGAARAFASASGLLELLTQGALLGLALVVFRALNPEFRLTTPVPPGSESGIVLRQPVNRRGLRQIGAAVVVSLWLLGYIGAWLSWKRWGGLGGLLAGPAALQQLWPRHAAWGNVAGLALVLGGLWLGWGEAGLLRPAHGQCRRVGTWRGVAAAALAGLALTPFAIPLAGWAQSIATEVLQGIGGAARSVWLTYLGSVLVIYPLALGAAGWTAASLARWSHSPGRERRALAAGLAAAGAAWLGVAALLHLAGPGRFDDGLSLARAADVPTGPDGVLTTLTLLPGPSPVIGLTPNVSGQGLTANEESAHRVWAYLRQRRFRTVHLFPALMHVCQCEALGWDSDRFLQLTLRSLAQNPHPGFCQLLIEKLAHCAATPTARAALAQVQDPRWFHFPPDGVSGLISLQRSVEPEGAEVRGRLFANGSPALGLRVGLIDERLWEQFRGVTRALSHRLVVTSSAIDAAGGFRLRHVPAGRYLMLVALPEHRLRRAPRRSLVEGSPGPITVAPGTRGVDIGQVSLFLPPRALRDVAQPARESAR